MGMQHPLHYGHLPPEFAAANALGVNVPVPLDPSQRLPPEQLAHHLDARNAHAGAHNLCLAMPNSARREYMLLSLSSAVSAWPGSGWRTIWMLQVLMWLISHLLSLAQ